MANVLQKLSRSKVAAAAGFMLAFATRGPAAAKDAGVAAGPSPPTREQLLASNADRLERIGLHLIVGFHNFEELRPLVEKRAIGGIFITDHNVRGRSAEKTSADIAALQDIRKEQGLPPLVVAADQEGGTVSRLSPPLARQASLAGALAKTNHDDERKDIVTAYAERQAAELNRLGVTLNFAPVVDLKLPLPGRDDGETRISQRAISADPFIVAKVAGWYCDALAEANVMCTLKHFPGLGRVTRDTHVSMAEISTSGGTLELNDWIPFRRVMTKPNAVTMLGHVRIGAVDEATPASYSAPVIKGLIRETWDYDGIIVTDDFSMGAIAKGKPGPGGAAVKSLNAGTDFVLLSYSEKDLDTVLSALIAADASGELDLTALARSRARIVKALSPRQAEEARN